MPLTSRHRRTLQAIFARPRRRNVRWSRIENLIWAPGGEVTEGRGSRVRFSLNKVVSTFHRPHPRPETDPGALDSVQDFLENAGVTPEDFAK